MRIESRSLHNDRSLGKRPRVQEACIKLCELAARAGEGEKLPTIVQLRDSLGLSIQTINDAVRELEKRNILRSVRGVGIYAVNGGSRQPAGSVGFVQPDLTHKQGDHAYWSLVLAGACEPARKVGRHLLLFNREDAADCWDKIDGVILYDYKCHQSLGEIVPGMSENFPCVTIINSIPNLPSVTIDDHGGMYQITRRLISQGHRRIAYLATFTGEPTLQRRREGYQRALNEAGIELRDDWTMNLQYQEIWGAEDDWYYAAGEYYVSKWISENWRQAGFTALVTQNDGVATGAIAAFEKAGYHVPGDVSVTGYDGVRPHYKPRLMTARVPLFDVGRVAMESLLQILNNPETVPSDVTLPCSIIQGESTAPPQ